MVTCSVSTGTPTRLPRWLAGWLIAVLLAGGTGFLVTGVQDVQHARTIGRRGVPALATVVEHDGHGKYAVQVTYPTQDGTATGVVPTDHAAYRYPVGSTLRVLYDPDRPTIVTLASRGGRTTEGLVQAVIGAVVLALVALAGATGLVRARRRRSPGGVAGRASQPG